MSVSTSTIPSTKRPSRSNSISSSVATVKKTPSVSSRSASRTSYLGNRPNSPESISRVLHSLNSSRSEFRGRTETVEGRKGSGGLKNNRWSHSTSSSLSAIDADLIRKRTSSLRKSSGYSSNATPSGPQGRSSLEYRNDVRGSPKRSSSTNNRTTTSVQGSRLAFRDSSNFKIVQDLAQSSSTNGTTGKSASNWEQSSGVNKFGEPVQSLSIHYTTTTTSAPSSQAPTQSKPRIDQSDRAEERSRPSFLPGRGKEYPKEQLRIRHSEAAAQKSQPPSRAQPRGEEPPNVGETKSPKRRDMLSKALAKANEAVLLDNAQNVNAAIEAYNEACELLQQVMVRSPDLADRRKLSSIKATYSRRIAELHDFDNTFVDLMRPLPEDPPIDEYENPEDFYQEETNYPPTAVNDAAAIDLPLRQESLLPEIFGGDHYIHDRSLPPVPNPLPSSTLNAPMDEQYMPPPLSPRPLLLAEPNEQDIVPPQDQIERNDRQNQQELSRSMPSTWLDQSDDQSSKSSSRLSSIDYQKQDGQLLSAIEAEFDAMSAAVDSAYNEETDQDVTPRNAEKSVVGTETRYDHLTGTYLDDEEEEEERLLESVAQDFEVEEARSGQGTVPRQSDSSGFSGRTWGSSVASTTATTRTTLSTLAEIIEPPLHSAPTATLPDLPRVNDSEHISHTSRPSSSDKHVGLRDRRMSGQSAKQLKIETFQRRSSLAQQTKTIQAAPDTTSTGEPGEPKELPSRTLVPAASFTSSVSNPPPLTPMLSIHSAEMHPDESPATPALTQGGSTDDGTFMDPSPSRHGRMMPPPPGPISKKNHSASNLGKTGLSINTGHLDVESPMTPGSAMFSHDSRKIGSAVTSAVSTSAPLGLNSMGLGGLYLFEDQIGDSHDPRSPNSMANEPTPLEPCPESFLLRPFWLMRCLYQALSHPRGGFVSTKLFIPRDIWRVRNVKIKALDDKIAQCDLLSAALLKLGSVDTLDANAVLEELQTFETILEQVRTALSKKLGNEVGLSGTSTVLKASPAGEEVSEPVSARPGNASSAAKSIASGWRKLRSKSSSANLAATTRSETSSSQTLTLASLPMTSSTSIATSRSYSSTRRHHPPPTPSALPQLLAPHAYYISSLARLFDAAQILDSIARQVEDPGLKYSSQTHVGLELSVRNAAEFFAFYVLRFVMNDLLMLLDKYLKRGGEWVMS